MKSLPTLFEEFSQLVSTGQTLEAMESYYAPSYTQQENEEPPKSGKAHWLETEKVNLEGVTELKATFGPVLFDETNQRVMGELQVFFISKKKGPLKLTEAFYQQWQDGEIVFQKFYWQKIQPVLAS